MDTIVLVKTLTALVYPAGFALVLLVMSLIFGLLNAKRVKWLCGVLAVLLLVVASNPLVAAWLAGALEQRYPQKELSEISRHDAIIVLGGGLRIPLPPAQHTQISSGSDRLWYAVRLYRSGLADKIILSGGNVYAQPGLASEAEYAAQLLQEWGVPQQAILPETGSRTTRQNQENTMLFLTENNIKSVLLVTSALHMPRAYALFKNTDIVITPASADVLVRSQNSPRLLSWIPSASALYLTTIALHEHYGYAIDRLRDRIE